MKIRINLLKFQGGFFFLLKMPIINFAPTYELEPSLAVSVSCMSTGKSDRGALTCWHWGAACWRQLSWNLSGALVPLRAGLPHTAWASLRHGSCILRASVPNKGRLSLSFSESLPLSLFSPNPEHSQHNCSSSRSFGFYEHIPSPRSLPWHHPALSFLLWFTPFSISSVHILAVCLCLVSSVSFHVSGVSSLPSP